MSVVVLIGDALNPEYEQLLWERIKNNSVAQREAGVVRPGSLLSFLHGENNEL